ncbi:FtsX-like permease family protein, partial [Kitasatospora sp. NPDC002227]|uniref:FtsX-like permease family protein n=1 Tax=Kitasatospora sp. NPDC002227 TaxID=3154773 RepID=UPI00333085F0
ARRDALRAKGRSALVLAMIALPVLGVTGADITYRSAQLTPLEQATRQLGTADLLVRSLAPGESVLQAPDAEDGITVSGHGRTPTAEQQRSLATDPAALIRQLLPSGATFTPVETGPTVGAKSHEGLLRTETTEADLADPVWRGRLDLTEGKAPAAKDEVAVTRAFLDQSGLRLGDTTTVQGADRSLRITGVVEHPGALGKVELVARPGELLDTLKPPTPQDNTPKPGGSWLVRLPAGQPNAAGWAKVQELNRYGFTATSREVALHRPARADVPYYAARSSFTIASDHLSALVVAVVVGMALLEVVLLAGPAFAVGARRSQRQLGLLAATGGERGQVRAVVLGGGIVLGAAGAVLGVAAGIAAVALVRPWAEVHAGSRFGHFDLRPADLLGIALLGVVTGLLAAVAPAVQAARQDVVAALRSRRTLRPASRRIALLGVLMLLGGAVLALYGAVGGSGRGLVVAAGMDRPMLAVVGGAVLSELGVVTLTPFLVGLCGRLGRRLPLGPRLALRDAVRHRARTAPAVAAVLAAVAGSVSVGIYTASSDAQARAEYRAAMPRGAVALQLYGESAKLSQARAAVAGVMPGLGERADVAQAAYVFCPGCSSLPELVRPGGGAQAGRSAALFGGVPVGDAAVLHNLFGVRDQAAEAALAGGKAVVFDPSYLKDGRVTLHLRGGAGGPVQPGQTPKPAEFDVQVPAVLLDRPVAAGYGPVLLGDRAARQAGLTPQDAGSVWLPAEVPGAKEEQRGAGAVDRLGLRGQVTVERGFRPSFDLVPVALTAFAALVALGAAGIATGLAAADSQRDLGTLTAVGAGPAIRRRLSGLQAGVIAGIGTVLGVVSGFVPAVALRRLRDGALSVPGVPHAPTVTVPWAELAVTLVGIPLTAAVLAALLTRARVPLTRRAE